MNVRALNSTFFATPAVGERLGSSWWAVGGRSGSGWRAVVEQWVGGWRAAGRRGFAGAVATLSRVGSKSGVSS